MSSQEITIRMQDLSPEYAEIMVIGNVLQKSGYFKDVRDQAQAVAKILYGRELGFSPIVSMSGIHIIEGKPALSSNLLAAMIKRSGKYDYRVVKWDDTECVLMFRQKVDGIWEDVGVSAFNIEDAKRAKVVREGSGWTRFPKAMLFARAISQGERTYCPDVSSCALYVPEELGATVNEEGEVTDLPKSAKPVAVTTEDIVIAGPTQSSAVTTVKGTAQASEKPYKPLTVDSPDVLAVVEAAKTVVANKANLAEKQAEYIDVGRQRNIHKEFRQAVRKDYALDKDIIFYTLLANDGFVDEEKVPTAARIPADRWFEVKERYLAKAAAL